MNCAECQTEPLTPGHYCPCCGRQLSLQERRAVDASSPAARCQSCGGPSADGDLCKSCEQAFAPLLGSATVAAPSDVAATAGVQKAPIVIKTTAAVPPPVVNVNAIQVEISRSDTAKAVADMTAKAHLAKAANPAPAPKRPIVAAPPQRRSRTTVWIKAAAVIVVAIGAAEGARRLGLHWPQPAAREELPVQATPVVASATAAERGATPPDTRSEAKMVAENRASASAIAPSKAAALRKPTTAAGRRRAVRQEGPSDQHVAPVVAAAPAPRNTRSCFDEATGTGGGSPAPPAGRFFERMMLTSRRRSQPALNATTGQSPARPHNDVASFACSSRAPVIVPRQSASRSGSVAHRTSCRRGVTRWTFSPAKKRGESVNCWYNIGVPLGKAN